MRCMSVKQKYPVFSLLANSSLRIEVLYEIVESYLVVGLAVIGIGKVGFRVGV